MIKFFKSIINQPKRQLLLTLAAEVCAVIAFGLFFTKGVTDAGGDGIATFRITFFSMARSFYFNAPLFIGFVFPMFVVLFTFIPNRNPKVYLAPAVVLLACGIMVACTYQCYLLPFTDENAEMVEKSGTHLSAEAAAAAALILISCACMIAKALSPAPVAAEPAQEAVQEPTQEEPAQEAVQEPAQEDGTAEGDAPEEDKTEE